MSWIDKFFKRKASSVKKEPQGNSGLDIKGFKFADISHHEKINMDKYTSRLLITKASEGISFVDSTFSKIQKGCHDRNIRFGAYHFFRGNVDGIAQAKFFISVAKTFDIAPILDAEVLDGVSIEKYKIKIKEFLDYLEKETGMIPIIYGGYYFLKDLRLDESFVRYPLWLADYRKGITIRPPVPFKVVSAWQYTDAEPSGGITRSDVNIYNDELDAFKILNKNTNFFI